VKVLFDTNIVLDVLLDRKPFSDHAAHLMSLAESSEIDGYLCATTMTTIHYLMAKSLGSKNAINNIRLLLTIFKIASVNKDVIEKALESGFSDYEDAVLVQAALHAGVEYIVTRNIKDFKKSSIPTYIPSDFIHILTSLKRNLS